MRSASRIMTISPPALSKPNFTASAFPIPSCLNNLLFHSGCARMVCSNTWYVLSVEWPSTKISSVSLPIRGIRAKMAGMLPASLRAGMMIETFGSSAWLNNGRATIKFVRANSLKGQNRTRNRFINGSSTGSLKGSRNSCQIRIGSKQVRVIMLTMSWRASQFCSRVGTAMPNFCTILIGSSHKWL